MRLKPVRVFLGLLLLAGGSAAQVNTGTVSGVARDSSASIVPGVNITVKNLDTGLTRITVTDDKGHYQAPSLPLGNYEVQAEKEGFQTLIRRGIELTLGREALVNFELQVGSVSQTVEVTGEAPLIETTSSSVAGLVETTQIQNLPLNGRSFDELALLQPAVTLSRARTGSFQSGFTAKLSIRGARPEQNSFLLDGMDVTGPTNQIPGSVGGQSLGVDTVREFRVETGTFSAQYGRAAGGVISAVTKSGTNELHGTVFEFLRNDNFDAARWETNRAGFKKPEFKRNQFGFSLGGPVIENKLFFFGGYEALRERLGQTLQGVVPTESVRAGRVANINAAGVITSTDVVTVLPAAVPYLNLYPLPNGPIFISQTGAVNPNLGDYTLAYSQPTNENYLSGRVDLNLSERDSLFGRYTFDDGTEVASNFSGLIETDTGTRNQYFTVEETHIFSPTLLNTIRLGVNRTYTTARPEVALDDDVLNRLAFVDGRPLFKSQTSIQPGGGVSNLATGNVPRLWAWNVFSGADDLVVSRGSHSIKGGILIQRMQFNVYETSNSGGVMRFRTLQDFVQGRPRDIATLFLNRDLGIYQRFTYYSWYVQDDIHWTPRFTLNLGLRHEFYTGPREKFGNSCTLFSLETGIRCGGRTFPTSATIKNFAPRAGFAWDVFGDAKTSVRGGIGFYFDSMSPAWWYSAGNDPKPPFEAEISNAALLAANFPNVTRLLSAGVTNDVVQTPTGAHITATPSTLQYTFTLQRQLSATTALALGYVGSQGRHLFMRAQENIVTNGTILDGRKFFPGPPAGTTNQQIRRNPAFGNTRFVRTEANSTYNALIASVNNRFRGGLQFQVSYTLGKSLDVLSSSTSSQIMDTNNWKLDRSLSDHDVRQTLSSNFTWELPLGNSASGLASKLLAGWQVGGVWKVNSSYPVNITNNGANWSRNGSTGSSIQERPDLRPGASNNPVLGSPDKWFDPSPFVIPADGFYGNNGRNTLSGPHAVDADFSVVKNTSVSEQIKMQFRAEFFNAINRANFGTPSTELFDGARQPIPTAGRITETTGTSRQIQFGLKFSW